MLAESLELFEGVNRFIKDVRHATDVIMQGLQTIKGHRQAIVLVRVARENALPGHNCALSKKAIAHDLDDLKLLVSAEDLQNVAKILAHEGLATGKQD